MSNPEARSAFAPHWRPVRGGADGPQPVTITRPARAMVTVQARKGQATAAAAAFARGIGVAAPAPARVTHAGAVSIYAIAPLTWLVSAPATDTAFVARVTAMVGTTASVVDQSHGKALLRVAGTRVGSVLDKVCRLDLHPEVFTTEHCGITEIAHTAVLIARAAGAPAMALPAFDLIIPSTFAIHVLEAIETAAAEFGWVRSDAVDTTV